MIGGHNRGIGRPVLAWQEPGRAIVSMGCVPVDDGEAFGSVKSMITRWANGCILIRRRARTCRAQWTGDHAHPGDLAPQRTLNFAYQRT
jgi:hypothetical protein